MPPDAEEPNPSEGGGPLPDTEVQESETHAPNRRRSVPAWVAVALGIACLALVGALLLVRESDDKDEDAGSGERDGAQLTGAPAIEDVNFGDCEDPGEDDLPTGTSLQRAGAVVTDSHVLMVAQVDGAPARSDNARGGDWQLSVSLQLWAPVGDHFEALYDFNVGSLNFGGLVAGDGRDGGLVDPAKVDYFTDGNYVGVLIDRSALSAIEGLASLSFAAQAIPQIYIDNGQPPSRTGVLTGWEERTSQWCPNERETYPVESFP